MARSANERVKAFRKREKVTKKQQAALVVEILQEIRAHSGLPDGEVWGIGYRISITENPLAINFDWLGKQESYDAIEARCNEMNFTLGAVIDQLEQDIIAALLAAPKGRKMEINNDDS